MNKWENLKSERLGEVKLSNEGCEMKIIEYNGRHDIMVEFQDEYKAKVHTCYGNFKSGKVKNPYHKSVYNVGYLGIGEYRCKNEGKYTKEYTAWHSMLQRCYDPYELNRCPTYINCFVCNEWHNFQNFAKWYKENYYECNDEKMCLDKDILIKGNKIYSPDTCMIVPERINTLFLKQKSVRGKYPIGVYWCKERNKYHVHFQMYDETIKKSKPKFIGRYDTIEEAFLNYKQFKENNIKQTADKYKDLIPQKLYEALYKYEVEIND